MQFGYTVLWVEDVEKTVAFYEQAFGLKRRLLIHTPLTLWAEMETGQTTIAFASYSEADVLFSSGYRRLRPTDDPITVLISFLTDEVPAAYDTAIAHGAMSVSAPKTEPWGQTIARLRDINGVLVSLATPFTPPAPGQQA